MSAVDEILAQIPLGQLAGQLGVDEQTAEQAARHALPALLGGIQANADDPGGAASLADAVQQHDGSLIEGGVDLDQVNTDDGQRIVGHVFGPHTDAVAQQLGGIGGLGDAGGQSLIQKLLPILAPIVMSYLAKRLTGGGGGAAEAGGGGGLGDVLGSVLGGALSGGGLGGGSGGGGGLGDVLGSVLGGGAGGQKSDGPDLGSLLGGLLGGGRR
jgi:hypothetical protein